jgi:hypothetical protein
MIAVVNLTKDDIVKVRHYPGKGWEKVVYGGWSFFSGLFLN